MTRVAAALSVVLVVWGMFDLALRTAPDGAPTGAAVPGLLLVGAGCIFALVSMISSRR